MTFGQIVLLSIAFVIGLHVYMFPTTVAFLIRGTKNRLAILVVNLLFGWAVLGLVWLGCIIWACWDKKEMA
jgi:hypothetical protein